MPELPEVETVRRSLDEKLCGARITNAETLRRDLRYPFPKNFSDKLVGCRITRVYRWAKYLLLELATPTNQTTYWLIHLGMSGQCRLLSEKEASEKHDHLQVDFDHGVRLHYRDPRRFGFMDWLEDLDTYRPFVEMGREAIFCSGTHPLARARGEIDGAYLKAQLASRRCSIKQALLDQRVVAGLGNIYINEALWSVGVHPCATAKNLPGQLFPALVESIHHTLQLAIQSGGSSLRDFVHTDGALGYFQHEWNVYALAGQPCKKAGCDGIIAQEKQQGRSSFFCPKHQRLFSL